MKKQTIYYATANAGKYEEVKRYIDKHEPSITLLQLDQDLPEIQSMDQKAIAIDKASKAWEILKKPVLVDDSGVYFEHYNNFPGTLSKFIYHGLGFEGLLKLVDEDNRARMQLYMIYKDKDETHMTFEGVCKGTIIRPDNFEAHPRLPYDAIFQPAGSDKRLALLRGTDEEKHYSYRLQALQKFLAWWKKGGQRLP